MCVTLFEHRFFLKYKVITLSREIWTRNIATFWLVGTEMQNYWLHKDIRRHIIDQHYGHVLLSVDFRSIWSDGCLLRRNKRICSTDSYQID